MRIKASSINSCILGLYLILCLAIFLVSQTSLKGVIHISLFSLSFFPYAISHRNKIGNYVEKGKLFRMVGASIIYIYIILILKGQIGAQLLYLLSAPFFAIFIYVSRFNLLYLNVTFLLIAFYFLLSVFIMGKDLDFVMASSRNYVSVIMMTTAAVLTVITYRQTRKIVLWPSILTTFLSILAVGRGGILFSAISLFGVWISANLNLIRKYRIAAIIILIGCVFVAIDNFDYIENIYESLDVFERMRSRGLHDYWREHLMEEYLKNMNFTTVLFGYDFTTNSEFRFLEYNPHNSYIRMHSLMGIMAVPYLGLIIYSLFRLLKNDKLYFVLFVTLLGRAYTDSVLFVTYYDYIVLLFICLGFNRTSFSCPVKRK